jgi:hypothetical protein
VRARRPAGAGPPELVVEDWHTECGACGYGGGGWTGSPADEGRPILTPESRVCPGCGVAFLRVVDVCAGVVSRPAVDDAA